MKDECIERLGKAIADKIIEGITSDPELLHLFKKEKL